MSNQPRSLNQSGGIGIDGNVSTPGDLVGRDKVINNDLGVRISAETINIYTTSSTIIDKSSSSAGNCEIAIECADIVNFACDAIVLKHAQAFYGVDGFIASIINPSSSRKISPHPNEFVLLHSNGQIATKEVLFVGTVPQSQFGYEHIRGFAKRAMEILAQEAPQVRHIGMTIHGAGFGLDERECFFAQVAGLLDAIRNKTMPSALQRITIVEVSQNVARRLKQMLREYLPSNTENQSNQRDSVPLRLRIDAAGLQSHAKPHIFVAMPSVEEMEDTFIFGIQSPINTAGYLCERLGLTAFTGDILTQIKSRIETASLIIADLTEANPNVYLEVGYAWGKNRPTLLIAKQGQDLKLDIQGQRCIMYKNIADLAKKLQQDLAELLDQS